MVLIEVGLPHLQLYIQSSISYRKSWIFKNTKLKKLGSRALWTTQWNSMLELKKATTFWDMYLNSEMDILDLIPESKKKLVTHLKEDHPATFVFNLGYCLLSVHGPESSKTGYNSSGNPLTPTPLTLSVHLTHKGTQFRLGGAERLLFCKSSVKGLDPHRRFQRGSWSQLGFVGSPTFGKSTLIALLTSKAFWKASRVGAFWLLFCLVDSSQSSCKSIKDLARNEPLRAWHVVISSRDGAVLTRLEQVVLKRFRSISKSCSGPGRCELG